MFPPRLKWDKPVSCLLWGKPDTGKTTEATRLAITWARKGLPCRSTTYLHGAWITADQYITYIMENQRLITNHIDSAALLLVDDLFNAFTSPKTVVILDRLLRKFFQEERIVIVTSNRTPEAIKAIDAGLMSRFERWGKVCKAKGYK